MFASLSLGSVHVDSNATMYGRRGPNAVSVALTLEAAPAIGHTSIVDFFDGRFAARSHSASSNPSESSFTYVDFQYWRRPFGKNGSNAAWMCAKCSGPLRSSTGLAHARMGAIAFSPSSSLPTWTP